MKNFFLFFCLILIAGCSKDPVNRFSGTGIGTIYSITYTGENNPLLSNSVDSLLKTISSQFSIFDSNSIISKINKNENILLNDDMVYIFKIADSVSYLSNGAFDISIAPLINLWGFGNIQKGDHQDYTIDSIREFIGYEKIRIENNYLVKTDPRIQINLNAIAKGYAVEEIGKLLAIKGVENYLVEVGGEITSKGTKNGKEWRVGIQVPTMQKDGPIESQYSFNLSGKAIATSGNYRNYLEENGIRYTHIIDPKSGKPEISNLLSVTILADNCAIADALATACMVMGLEKSMQFIEAHPQYAAYFIYDDNGEFVTQKSSRFP